MGGSGTSRGGISSWCQPCPAPHGHPQAPGLTTMALSSMLLGKRLRPPNCRVFRKFCSQALAMPGGDGDRDEGWS